MMGYEQPTRRSLLKAGLLAGGGLLVSFSLPGLARAAEASAAAEAEFEPNAFLRIDPQGVITFISPHTEFGQGIYTSTAMLIAEELDVGLDQIQMEAAPPDLAKYKDPLLGDQATGGSASTRADWVRMRQAGATARIMLVQAAAQQWKIDPAQCQVTRGVIHHPASARTLSYGEVATLAAALPVPGGVKLKDPSQFTLIGTRAKRLDTPAKVNGTAVFGIDAKVPGMLIGTLAITPVRGGKLVSIDEAAAQAGPRRARCDPHGGWYGRGGDRAMHMWAAIQGLKALQPVWDAGPNGGVTTEALIASLDQASQKQGVIAKQEGDAAGAINAAATKISAVYQLPFLAHAPMEPLNCTLHIQPDQAEIWVGTQVPVRAQNAVAAADRPAAGEGEGQQPLYWRRVRPPAGYRQHRGRGANRQAGELSGETGMDARGGSAPRLLPALLL